VLSLYTEWVGQLGRRRSSMATRLIRRWAMQMALNIMLIAAVFIAAAFAIQHPPAWLISSKLSGEWLKAGLWLTAVILSLPMVIATLKKLQALGLLVAEMKVTEASAGERTVAIRSIVAQIIPIIGTVILGGYIIILSSTFLPNFKVFIVLLAIAALVSWFLRRSFIKVYSKAQVALQETFSQTPPPKTETMRETLPTVFRDAALETVTIPAGSSGVGKRIRELQLRSLTGASIVGIERGEQSLVNPDPDEELHVQDRLLLVGTRTQLDAAKILLEQ